MLAPLMAKPQVKAAGPARARSALGRAGDRVHERRIDPVHATRAVPQTGPFFPSHKAPAAWALSQIPIHPPGRADAPRLPAAAPGKLKVGAANDPREHEADRVADRVMRAHDPAGPGAAAPQAGHNRDGRDHEQHSAKSRSAARSPIADAPPEVHDTLRASGNPLDPASRAFFEPRLGRDLASVRVHADDKAAKSAGSIDAHAYTAGDHVVLGEGKSAATPEAKRVMAHELTHVAQQKGEAPTVQRSPIPHPPAADAKQAAKPKPSSLNSYIDLFNGFQDLATDAINRGGVGLDTAQAHFGGDLSATHRGLLKRVQFVLIEAQDDQAKRLDAAQAWPGLAAQLQEAVSEARRWPSLGSELAAVIDDIGMLSRSYVHAKAGKAEPEAETFGDYADSVSGMNDLLYIFGRMGESGDGLQREQVAGRNEVETSRGVQSANAHQRAELAKVKFGARLNARHAKVLDTLRTALLLARSEEPGSGYKALQLWRSIEGDLEHVLQRAPTYQVEFDVAGVEAEVKSAAEALAVHYAAVHRESVGVALTKPRTQQEVKAEREVAKAAGPVFGGVLKEKHVVDDFRYALGIIEQHLTPSKDHPGEYVLTSGPTVIRVRADQADALHATVAKELKTYMAQLVKAMVRVWETYDSIQRGNSSFKLGLLGGFGGATDPGDQSDFKNRIIAVRDQTVYPLVDQGRFVEAFKWIMVQKDMVDRQAKEVNDYDSDLDVGYSRLAIAASVVQVALMALVPVAGEAAIAGGAGLLAVGGTAVAAGAGGAAIGETTLEVASGEGLHGGKIASKAYAGGVIGLGAIAPAATKSVTNFIAPAGLLAPAEGTALVGANALASGGVGALQSKASGGGALEGFVGGSFGSLAGSATTKALGPLATNPVVKTLVAGGVGAGVAEATDSDPLAGFVGGITGSLAGEVFEPGAKGPAPASEPAVAAEPALLSEPPLTSEVPAPVAEPPAGPTIASETIPLRSSYTPSTEEAPLGTGPRSRSRARPFYAKDPKATAKPARPKATAKPKAPARAKPAPVAEAEPKPVSPEAAVPATPAKTMRRPWRPTAELDLSRQRLKLAQEARDRAVAGMQDAAPGTPEFEQQRARRDAAGGAIADVYAQVKVDAAKFRRYQKALARWKAANPGKASKPPPELELEGYKPGPGERTTTQEEYDAARRDFRSIDPEQARAQVERALDELAGPDDPAEQPPSPDVEEALAGGKAAANAAPGRVTQAAEAVVAEAMGSAGIKSGKKVPFYKGADVGKDLHGRIEALWANRPELAGIEHHVETTVGDLLPADSPIRNMTVEQFLQNRGEHLVIDQLQKTTLKSKIGNLQMDMMAKLPDGSTLIFDLTSQAEGPHLAKSLLYGLIFSEQGVPTHVGETYWRSFNTEAETPAGPASAKP